MCVSRHVLTGCDSRMTCHGAVMELPWKCSVSVRGESDEGTGDGTCSSLDQSTDVTVAVSVVTNLAHESAACPMLCDE